MDFERRVCFDAYLSSGVDLEGIAAVGESSVSVKKSGKDGGEEFDGVFRLQDHHIKSTVAWLIDVGHRNAELNLGEINQQHTQAFRFDGLAIDGEHDGGMLRDYIGSCREKIRNGTEELLIGRGAFHNRGIVACARHNHETALLRAELDFAHVEFKHFPGTSQIRQRMGLVRPKQIQRKQIRRPCGVGKNRNPRVAKAVSDRGDSAVSA